MKTTPNLVRLLKNTLVGAYRYQNRNPIFDAIKKKIKDDPPRTPGIVEFGNLMIEYVDATNLLEMIQFHLVEGYNDFSSDIETPYILDCGSNIGVSIFRFKALYPNSRIIAFEPDPTISDILRRNLERNRIADVKVIEAAVWTNDSTISFHQEGMDAGRIIEGAVEAENIVTLPSVDLKRYLTNDVDMLKIDVEGAEDTVLIDCAPYLHRVKNILIEVHYRFESPDKITKILEVLTRSGFHVSICTHNYFNMTQLKKREQSTRVYHLIPVISGWR